MIYFVNDTHLFPSFRVTNMLPFHLRKVVSLFQQPHLHIFARVSIFLNLLVLGFLLVVVSESPGEKKPPENL